MVGNGRTVCLKGSSLKNRTVGKVGGKKLRRGGGGRKFNVPLVVEVFWSALSALRRISKETGKKRLKKKTCGSKVREGHTDSKGQKKNKKALHWSPSASGRSVWLQTGSLSSSTGDLWGKRGTVSEVIDGERR